MGQDGEGKDRERVKEYGKEERDIRNNLCVFILGVSHHSISL
jgi:hypothetical protein